MVFANCAHLWQTYTATVMLEALPGKCAPCSPSAQGWTVERADGKTSCIQQPGGMKREEDRLLDRRMFSDSGLLNDDPRTIFGVGGQQSTP
jgi:hypothetical protein